MGLLFTGGKRVSAMARKASHGLRIVRSRKAVHLLVAHKATLFSPHDDRRPGRLLRGKIGRKNHPLGLKIMQHGVPVIFLPGKTPSPVLSPEKHSNEGQQKIKSRQYQQAPFAEKGGFCFCRIGQIDQYQQQQYPQQSPCGVAEPMQHFLKPHKIPRSFYRRVQVIVQRR